MNNPVKDCKDCQKHGWQYLDQYERCYWEIVEGRGKYPLPKCDKTHKEIQA